MNARIFVDTNVIVYRFDTTEAEKHQAAEAWLDRLWESRSGRLSTQVLHEIYATLTRKLVIPVADARTIVRSLHAWDPVRIDDGILEGAWGLEDRFSLSFWDALIVAAARFSEATYLLTEDLQHGQDFDGLQVVSPFVAAPEMILPAERG
jgi:predicted nucleic acid-binding protein